MDSIRFSDARLPANLAENIAIINKIARAAHDVKLEMEDVVVDRFMTTIGANPFLAQEFWEAMGY